MSKTCWKYRTSDGYPCLFFRQKKFQLLSVLYFFPFLWSKKTLDSLVGHRIHLSRWLTVSLEYLATINNSKKAATAAVEGYDLICCQERTGIVFRFWLE